MCGLNFVIMITSSYWYYFPFDCMDAFEITVAITTVMIFLQVDCDWMAEKIGRSDGDYLLITAGTGGALP